jgi:integration host factor subunit alpha
MAALTRGDLANAIYTEVGVSRAEAAEHVELIIQQIIGSLEVGEDVKISSFGNFVILQKRARIGRNPKTGNEVTIAPRRVISFRPSQILKDKVSNAQ